MALNSCAADAAHSSTPLKSTFSHGPEQAAALRRLKWLGLALILSNLILGCLSVYLLRAQDRDYSRLIDESVPLLHEAVELRLEAGAVARAVTDAVLARTPAEAAAAVERAQAGLRRGDVLRSEAANGRLLAADGATRQELVDAGEAFDREVRDVLGRAGEGSSGGPGVDALRGIGVSMDRYSTAVQDMAETVQTRTEALSDFYTAATRSRSFVVLGLAGWPLILAAAIVALTVAVVATMLFVFRQADAGDGP
jgi:hypothetical protein